MRLRYKSLSPPLRRNEHLRLEVWKFRLFPFSRHRHWKTYKNLIHQRLTLQKPGRSGLHISHIRVTFLWLYTRRIPQGGNHAHKIKLNQVVVKTKHQKWKTDVATFQDIRVWWAGCAWLSICRLDNLKKLATVIHFTRFSTRLSCVNHLFDQQKTSFIENTVLHWDTTIK